MQTKGIGLLMAVAISMLPRLGFAEEPTGEMHRFTLPLLIEFVQSHAPEVRFAATQLAEGEARLIGSQARALENPKLSATAGPSNGGKKYLPNASVGIEIPVELGGRRGKRISLAEEGLRRDRYQVEDTKRQAVEYALNAFFQVLEAEAQLTLAGERTALAEEFLRVSKERHALGDIPLFEVNLAQTEDARAANDKTLWEGRAANAKNRLSLILGLPPGSEISVEGDLHDRSVFDSINEGTGSSDRADILLAQAEVRTAEAEIGLAQAERSPDLSLMLNVGREDDSNVVQAGFTVTIPWFNPKNGAVLEAQARSARAKTALEIKKAALRSEVQNTRNAYGNAVLALRHMETEILPQLQENEVLARESFKAGKISLANLLQLRRDALETRRDYIERLREVADAGVSMAAATDSFPEIAKK